MNCEKELEKKERFFYLVALLGNGQQDDHLLTDREGLFFLHYPIPTTRFLHSSGKDLKSFSINSFCKGFFEKKK